MFDCLRNCQTAFQSSYTIYIPPAVYEVSDCFTPSPSLVIVCLFDSNCGCGWGFPGGAEVKVSACNVGDLVRSLGREDPLEKEMATHSSILAWRIPWMEELGRLQSTGRKESVITERLHFTSCLWVWIGISLWFWFAVPWWLKVFSIFLCACLLFVCFSWRNAYSTSFPVLKIGLLAFSLLSCKVFSYYGYDYLTTQFFFSHCVILLFLMVSSDTQTNYLFLPSVAHFVVSYLKFLCQIWGHEDLPPCGLIVL